MSLLTSLQSVFGRLFVFTRATSASCDPSVVTALEDDYRSAFTAFRPGSIVRAGHMADVLNHIHSGVNLFEAAPDGRQSSDTEMPTSRFRPRYRALSDEEKALHDAIKSKAGELEALFERVPAGRYRSLGLTDLESAVMWTAKALTA